MSSNVLYLSHARVSNGRDIPLDELVSKIRALARQFPMPIRSARGNELRDLATSTLQAMPPRPDVYWHGSDKRPCPCMSCSSEALRLIGPELAPGASKRWEQKSARTRARS